MKRTPCVHIETDGEDFVVTIETRAELLRTRSYTEAEELSNELSRAIRAGRRVS